MCLAIPFKINREIAILLMRRPKPKVIMQSAQYHMAMNKQRGDQNPRLTLFYYYFLTSTDTTTVTAS